MGVAPLLFYSCRMFFEYIHSKKRIFSSNCHKYCLLIKEIGTIRIHRITFNFLRVFISSNLLKLKSTRPLYQVIKGQYIRLYFHYFRV